MAYYGDESGRTEVYVQTFPEKGGKRLVSEGGGINAIWSRDGKELFYRRNDQILAVEVETAPGFSTGKPEARGADPAPADARRDRGARDVGPGDSAGRGEPAAGAADATRARGCARRGVSPARVGSDAARVLTADALTPCAM